MRKSIIEVLLLGGGPGTSSVGMSCLCMDRADLRRLLTATEREIAQGEILIQNQRWRIETLKRDGQDTADADEALHSLVRNQATQEQHRVKLKKSLDE